MKKIERLAFQFEGLPIDTVVNWMIKHDYISLVFSQLSEGWEVRYKRLKKFNTEEIKEELSK